MPSQTIARLSLSSLLPSKLRSRLRKPSPKPPHAHMHHGQLPSHTTLPETNSPPPVFPEATSKNQEPVIPDPSIFTSTPLRHCHGGRFDIDEHTYLPTVAQCAVHLELLEAFWKLHDQVTVQDYSHFEIVFGSGGKSAKEQIAQQVMGNEKEEEWVEAWVTLERERIWKAFLELAVVRFEIWWTAVERELVVRDKENRATDREDKGVNDSSSDMFEPIELPAEMLPPLDVLMVWHSYMLNPRCYYDDCLRLNMKMILKLSFPWEEIHVAIDPNTWTYTLPPSAGTFFASKSLQKPSLQAHLKPHNHNEPYTHPTIKVQCAGCTNSFSVPVTDPITNTGWIDENFSVVCNVCGIMDREALATEILRAEINKILAGTTGIRLRGTYFDSNGNTFHDNHEVFDKNLNINTLIRQTFATPPTRDLHRSTKSLTTALLKSSSSTKPIKHLLTSRIPALYSTPSKHFSLSLPAAVSRQYSFIKKMHQTLWIRSPSLSLSLPSATKYTGTLPRAITRYTRFFKLFERYPGTIMVPTLDIDLVWHTQMLFAGGYRVFSRLRGGRRFIDHDDGLEGGVLVVGEGAAGKGWREMRAEAEARDLGEYGEEEWGEYITCGCWYCECFRSELSLSRAAHSHDPSLINPNLDQQEHGKEKQKQKIDLEWKCRVTVEFYRQVELRRRHRNSLNGNNNSSSGTSVAGLKKDGLREVLEMGSGV